MKVLLYALLQSERWSDALSDHLGALLYLNTKGTTSGDSRPASGNASSSAQSSVLPETIPCKRLDRGALGALLVQRNLLVKALCNLGLHENCRDGSVDGRPSHDTQHVGLLSNSAITESASADSDSKKGSFRVRLPEVDAPADTCRRCPQLRTCTLLYSYTSFAITLTALSL